MRTFKKFPKHKQCLICNTNENKECVLIVDDSKINGNIGEAVVVHLECINLLYNKENNLFYQRLS